MRGVDLSKVMFTSRRDIEWVIEVLVRIIIIDSMNIRIKWA
jgi:hypothetical protein